jgi:hypothetical protein
MSALTRALLDDLGPDDLAALAERLAPFLRPASAVPDGWLTTREAAAYAGVSVNALQRAAGLGDVHSEQRCHGGKRFFRRSDLDAWRREA